MYTLNCGNLCNPFLPNSVRVDDAEDLDEVIKLSRWVHCSAESRTQKLISKRIQRTKQRPNPSIPSAGQQAGTECGTRTTVALRLVEKNVSLNQQNRWGHEGPHIVGQGGKRATTASHQIQTKKKTARVVTHLIVGSQTTRNPLSRIGSTSRNTLSVPPPMCPVQRPYMAWCFVKCR